MNPEATAQADAQKRKAKEEAEASEKEERGGFFGGGSLIGGILPGDHSDKGNKADREGGTLTATLTETLTLASMKDDKGKEEESSGFGGFSMPKVGNLIQGKKGKNPSIVTRVRWA